MHVHLNFVLGLNFKTQNLLDEICPKNICKIWSQDGVVSLSSQFHVWYHESVNNETTSFFFHLLFSIIYKAAWYLFVYWFNSRYSEKGSWLIIWANRNRDRSKILIVRKLKKWWPEIDPFKILKIYPQLVVSLTPVPLAIHISL